MSCCSNNISNNTNKPIISNFKLYPTENAGELKYDIEVESKEKIKKIILSSSVEKLIHDSIGEKVLIFREKSKLILVELQI